MASDYHRPARFPPARFEGLLGSEDPAQLSRAAHEVAAALIHRVRERPDPEVVERLVSYTDTHGIDAIAELWSRSSARSLPGALWRIYLLRAVIREDSEQVSYYFGRGLEAMHTIDPVVVGAPVPAGPAEVSDIADHILRGAFSGDFGMALERAAAFARITASGCVTLADDVEVLAPERATELTTRALRLRELADDLASAARLWRRDALD